MSAISVEVSIISFTTVIGVHVGVATGSFTLIFSLTSGIIKKVLSITRNKKKKNMTKYLFLLKVNKIVLKL